MIFVTDSITTGRTESSGCFSSQLSQQFPCWKISAKRGSMNYAGGGCEVPHCGQKIFPGHGEHGDITVGLTNYPYSCFIIAGGIFFKQVWNIFLHTVIGSAGEVGKKQPGFIICSSGAGDHPPSQQGGAEREDCLLDFCLRGLAERAI
ncbi:TPA: hypothetical protein HIR94_004652 [Escherichia coli]|uniref:hypothetical protein n=3 Tax=Escherichia TaxID=561 RepID=UPI001402A793|nr:hypothetical protein [Escherichia coli]EIM3109602.1 hypothetical protein [Escherichia coli]HAI0725954.1 hypothetical protein [Escherichia coli]HAM4528178.1 hypothetical protein [Escherichia coli]